MGSTSHHMEPSAALLDHGALATGYRVHHPHPGKGACFVARRSATGASERRIPWRCAPVSIAYADGLVLVATLDGRIAALDARTGATAGETQLRVEGLAIVPTSLAVRGDHLAAATTDGRVVLVAIR